MTIDVLYLGHIACGRDWLVKCEDKSQMIKSPVSAILIRHPKLGNILYDTGNSPFYSSEYTNFALETYPIPEFISIEDALREKGLTPGDIDMIILSHLHFDHAGGLRYFRRTKAIQNVWVAEEELKNAWYEVMTGRQGSYIRELFDVEGIVYRGISGEIVLAEDLRLFVQKSHTPGGVGLVLETKSRGTIITTSDTVYAREKCEKRLPPGGTINKTEQEFYDNLAVIEEMKEKYSAEILFGHDYEQIVQLAEGGSIQ